VHCYTLSNEFRKYKMVFDARVGTSVCEYRTSLRHSLVCVRTDGAYKSIEGVHSVELEILQTAICGAFACQLDIPNNFTSG